jgi:hypothetical protein
VLDGVMLLPPGCDDVLHLNATASGVWERLDRAATTADLIAETTAVFDVSQAEAALAIEELLAQLLELAAVVSS